MQLNYLITQFSKTFLGFSLENLIVIDKNKFIYICDEFLLDINQDEKILISFPFTHDDFFWAPELIHVKKIPSFINYKVTYFSLGSLILHALLGEYNLIDFNEEDKIRQHNLKRLLNMLFIKKIILLYIRCYKRLLIMFNIWSV